MNKKNKNFSAERGSAILWILVAVGLFAALNFTFNSNTRTSTSLLDDTQAEAYANQIIQYGNEVKSAVKRLQLRGCSDTEISFENDVVTGYENPNAPDDGSCDVFNIAGGGVNWSNLSKNAFKDLVPANINFAKPFYIANFGVVGVGDDCTDESCSELSLLISDVDLNVCIKINETARIGTPTSDGITNYQPQAYNPTKFVGSYAYINIGSVIGNVMTNLSQKKYGCFINSGGGSNIPTFYQVLIAR